MRDTYGIENSRQQHQLFTAWANLDPVDEWELERNRRIAAIQGNGNPYVSDEEFPGLPDMLDLLSQLETPPILSCNERKNLWSNGLL